MEYRIKDILKDRGIRIEDFAEIIGVKRETLSRIINGASTSSETLQTIADKLELHISDLFARNSSDTIGIIRHNGKPYEINSIEDIERVLEEIKTKEITTQ